VKYELDKRSGRLLVDRVLFSAVHCPVNYGFVPQTYRDDGDPIDILVLCQEAIQPLAIMQAELIGVMNMRDERGKDKKLIAVQADEPEYSHCSVSELPPHRLRELERFFQDYKALENKRVLVEAPQGRSEALRVLERVDPALRPRAGPVFGKDPPWAGGSGPPRPGWGRRRAAPRRPRPPSPLTGGQGQGLAPEPFSRARARTGACPSTSTRAAPAERCSRPSSSGVPTRPRWPARTVPQGRWSGSSPGRRRCPARERPPAREAGAAARSVEACDFRSPGPGESEGGGPHPFPHTSRPGREEHGRVLSAGRAVG